VNEKAGHNLVLITLPTETFCKNPCIVIKIPVIIAQMASEYVQCRGSQSVLHGPQGIRDQYSEDPHIYFCNTYIDFT